MKKGFTSQKATPQGVLPGISWFLNKALLLFLLVSGMAFLTGQAWGQTFTTPGTHYVTVASGQTVTLEAWGGGGAGGGAISPSGMMGLIEGAHCGAGGGGGAYASYVYTNSTPSTVTLVITVGTGGTANSGAAGGNGGYSSVQVDAGGGPGAAVVQADGGSGGNANTSGGTPTGGIAGNGSIGTIVSGSNGGNGATGWTTSTGAGGNGGNGGAGGPGFDGFGVTQDGNPGTQPGGGGSGSRASIANPGTTTGGGGGDGQVVVTLGAVSCTNGFLTLVTAGTDNQSLCGAGAITPIEYVISGGATGVEVTGISFTGIIASFDSPTQTLTLTGTASGTINYTVTTIGTASPCTNATMTGTITVNEIPEVSIDEENLCVGSTTNVYPATGGTWSTSDSDVATVVDGLVTAINPGVATLTYLEDVTYCSNTLQVWVWDPATITLTSGDDEQVVCETFAIDPIVYTYGGGATTATFETDVVGIDAVIDVVSKTITISGIPENIGTYTVTAWMPDSPCPPVSMTGEITMIPTPTLELTAGENIQTICQDTEIGPITYTFGGGAISASVSFGPGLESHDGTVSGTTIT